MWHKRKGFTLVELTVVIVILAIISAVAVPKFINVSSDAKKAKIASVAAELRTAINLIYYKSLLLGLENECHEGLAKEVIVDGFLTCKGYPIGYISSIKKLLNLDNNEGFIFQNSDASGHRILAISLNETYYNGEKLVNKDGQFVDDKPSISAGMNYCQLLYQPMGADKVVVLDDGC